MKDADFYLGRLEELCCSFKQSMCMDHLPYPTALSFKRYLGLIIDIFEVDNNASPLCYSLDLLRDLYAMNNTNLLFDDKASSLSSVSGLGDYKSLERPVYPQSIRYSNMHVKSKKLPLYAHYLQDINKYLSSRLNKHCIYLEDDFSAETKIQAGVSAGQIKNVVQFLQGLGYIEGDEETAKAFISIFEGSTMAQQKMKITWKCKNKKGDSGSTTQNIAALYVLFKTIGVDMKSAENRKVLEQIFLDSGQLKKRKDSDFLKRFRAQIEEVLKQKNGDG